MAIEPLILLNGTTADANEVMALFNEIYGNIDETNVQPANKTGSGRFVLDTAPTLTSPTLTTPKISGAGAGLATLSYQNIISNVALTIPYGGSPTDTFVTVNTLQALIVGSGIVPPIGAVIPWQDWGAVALTFDTNYWRYCDGSVLSYPASPLNGQTLEDMSGRYLVGFGTDGGGDIDTAPWAATPVGNAGNTINIQHVHTMPHVHAGPSHFHDPGTLRFKVATFTDASSAWTYYTQGGSVTRLGYDPSDDGSGDFVFSVQSTGSDRILYTDDNDPLGNTGNSGTGNTGAASSSTTNNSLSITQSIQPRSMRVRYLIRVL